MTDDDDLRARSGRRWTREGIIELLRAAAVDGVAPTTRAFEDQPGTPSSGTIKAKFGSWSAALEAAGLQVKPKPQAKPPKMTGAQRAKQERQQAAREEFDEQVAAGMRVFSAAELSPAERAKYGL